MNHGSLFSGIGGFDLAAEWMGWNNVFHCEINPFGKQVLNYYWPKSISYDDIKTTDFTIHRGTIDILTGGFPCQPYSQAGKRLGKEDDRHLWPYMLRAIREIKPRWIVGENVSGIISWNGGMVFDEVQVDLETEGYEVQAYVLPACGVNAPHRRDRVWFVAYTNCKCGKGWTNDTDRGNESSPFIGFGKKWDAPDTTSNRREWQRQGIKIEEGLQQGSGSTGKLESGLEGLCCIKNVTDANSDQRCEGRVYQSRPKQAERHAGTRDSRFGKGKAWLNFPTQPPVRGRNDGIPPGLFGITVSKHRNESIKAYGNAIVPQVAHQIFKAIQQYESTL